MKRYAVTSKSTGVTHALCETLGEAVAAAVRMQDEGGRPVVVDSQGSGAIVIGPFDLQEAESGVGRSLGSEEVTGPLTVADVLKTARATAPKKQIYHWDVSGPEG